MADCRRSRVPRHPPCIRWIVSAHVPYEHLWMMTMKTLVRTFGSTLLVSLLVCFPSIAAGQPVIVGNGTIAPSWDGSLAGFELLGDSSSLVAEYLGGSPTPGLRVGDVADLSTTIDTSSNHPFTERISGTTYQSVWVRAQLQLAALPFTVPPRPAAGTFNALSTSFKLDGTFAGYSDQAMTQQVFAVTVRGVGVAEFVWTQFQDETYLAAGGGGTIYRLTWPVDFPWAFTDVGAVGQFGNSGTASGGRLYMGGSGEDIWGTADSFGFTWRSSNGDGEVTAQITNQANTSPFAKAGLMIRTSPSDAASAHVLIDVKPNHEIELMTRPATGGATTYVAGTQVPGAVWLKLRRAGAQVTGLVSTDGSNWISVGSASFPSGPAHAGLAVTSHNNNAVNQAVVEERRVTESQAALDRSDWTASATGAAPADPPANALDGRLDTRFSTGHAQHDSQGIFVSWPGDRTIGRIRMEVGPSTGDYPRTCGIWAKDSVGTVTFVNCQADANGTVEVSFTPIPAQKIEVWQWGSTGWWWSIAEFNVFKQ